MPMIIELQNCILTQTYSVKHKNKIESSTLRCNGNGNYSLIRWFAIKYHSISSHIIASPTFAYFCVDALQIAALFVPRDANIPACVPVCEWVSAFHFELDLEYDWISSRQHNTLFNFFLPNHKQICSRQMCAAECET